MAAKQGRPFDRSPDVDSITPDLPKAFAAVQINAISCGDSEPGQLA
jgi:hypothetical protein